jgi:hypothetical protein
MAASDPQSKATFDRKFDQKHYFPILKWKRGEARALKELAPAVKAACTPVLEIVPVPYDFKAGTDKKSLAKHLSDAVEEMASSWGTSLPVLVDIRLLPKSAATGKTLTALFDLLRRERILAVPVISTTSTADIVSAAAAIHKKDGRGVCLREAVDVIIAPGFSSTVAATLLAVGAGAGAVDLVIDMQDVSATKKAANLTVAKAALNNVPNVKTWRSLVLCATAFPINLSGIAPGVHGLPRADWALWTNVGPVARLPTFGDYAVAHWDLQELDPRVIKISASIRYTTDDEWVIFRGRNVNMHGFGQFTTFSKQLVKHAAYSGPTFSAGDAYVAACAAGGSPGNHETWRRVATNHHITFVVNQLATRAAASTPAAPSSATGMP